MGICNLFKDNRKKVAHERKHALRIKCLASMNLPIGLVPIVNHIETRWRKCTIVCPKLNKGNKISRGFWTKKLSLVLFQSLPKMLNTN
jgi:hypothetical protein